MSDKQKINIYPAIEPTAPPFEPKAETFRLQEIRKVRTEIEADIQKYLKCKRRYSSLFDALNYTLTGLNFINAAEASVSVGLLATGIGIPISIALAATAGVSSLVSILLGVVNKKVCKKLDKHEAISSLGFAKLTSLNLIISKALEDSQISDQEFVLVQRDFEEYKKQKHDIQVKTRETPNIEDIKKKFVEQGRQMERKDLKKLIEPTNSQSS